MRGLETRKLHRYSPIAGRKTLRQLLTCTRRDSSTTIYYVASYSKGCAAPLYYATGIWFSCRVRMGYTLIALHLRTSTSYTPHKKRTTFEKNITGAKDPINGPHDLERYRNASIHQV